MSEKFSDNKGFPLFRKLVGSQTYYRIESLERMFEIRTLGRYYNVLEIKARILPERLHIQDLIDNSDNRWVAINEKEYDDFLAECHRNLTPRDF